MTNDDVSVPGDLGQKLIPEDHTSKKQQKAIATMAAAPPHALEVTPESALQFVLTRDGDGSAASDGSSAKCTMTLRHTGQTTESIAFKVRQEASDVLFWGRDVCLFSLCWRAWLLCRSTREVIECVKDWWWYSFGTKLSGHRRYEQSVGVSFLK